MKERRESVCLTGNASGRPDCGNGGIVYRWPVEMDFRREELMYDIGNLAYNEAEAAEMADDRRHKVKDVMAEENADRIVRVMDRAFTECVEAMYSQTKERIEPVTWVDNEPGCCEVWSLPAFAPCDLSVTTVRSLKEHVHEYMVARAMEEWLGVWIPAAARKYAERAEGMMAEIHEAKNRRVGRVRRTLSVF